MEIYKATYQIEEKKDYIKIFSKYFVKKNRLKFKIVYQNKLLPLTNIFKFSKKEKEKLKIKILILDFNRLDLSFMFSECSSLIEFNSLSNIEKETKIIDNFGKKKNINIISISNNNKNLICIYSTNSCNSYELFAFSSLLIKYELEYNLIKNKYNLYDQLIMTIKADSFKNQDTHEVVVDIFGQDSVKKEWDLDGFILLPNFCDGKIELIYNQYFSNGLLKDK